MFFYKGFVMDIVVKIKQCLLVVFIVGNVQLVAMHLGGHEGIVLPQQFNNMQKNINMLVDTWKKRLKDEQQSFAMEINFFETIVQALSSYQNTVNLIDRQKNLMSQSEYKKFEIDVANNCLTYNNLILTQDKRISELKIAISDIEDSLKVLQNHANDLRAAKMTYELEKNKEE